MLLNSFTVSVSMDHRWRWKTTCGILKAFVFIRNYISRLYTLLDLLNFSDTLKESWQCWHSCIAESF